MRTVGGRCDEGTAGRARWCAPREFHRPPLRFLSGFAYGPPVLARSSGFSSRVSSVLFGRAVCGVALCRLVLAGFIMAILPAAPTTTIAAPGETVVDVRTLGAIGDGTVHRVQEWIAQGRYRSLAELQRDYPEVASLHWSIDEAAFTRALALLPVEGGTILLPAGRYVAAAQSWTIRRDHVRLLGDGADRTILSTAPGLSEALVLSPYRHGGWRSAPDQIYPIGSDSGGAGAAGVQLRDAAWASDFRPGELIFIRNGACRFDQDYGEFNEVVGTDGAGFLRLRHPLSRDYTLARLAWAGEVANGFALPAVQQTAVVAIRTGEGYFSPKTGDAISIGGELLAVAGVTGERLSVRNPGRANAPAGTVIPAGARIAVARGVIRLTQTTRDFRAEALTIIGRRKVVVVSNSYGSVFRDCVLIRDPEGVDMNGGLTIDGDDGRWARFERCTVRAAPPWPMQFARSFGGVVFSDCVFTDANVGFTEFNFDCEVRDSVFLFRGGWPSAVVVVGKSCGDLRILENRIYAENAAAIFSGHLDIQSQKLNADGDTLIGNNTIQVVGNTPVFSFPASRPPLLIGNRVANPPDLKFPDVRAVATTIAAEPEGAASAEGGEVVLAVVAGGSAPLDYQWRRAGRALAGATDSTLALRRIGPDDVGVYDVAVTGVTTAHSRPVVVGVRPPAGARVAGAVVTTPQWQGIRHPNGAIYDQFLLAGAAGTFTALPGRIARMSFLDPRQNIVQVELAGAGAVTVVLEDPVGPVAPVLYRQQEVRYMQGTATVVLAGADATTHLSVYSVGPRTNPGVTRPEVTYDGWARLAAIGIATDSGAMGGLHLGDVAFGAQAGFCGVLAPSLATVAQLPVPIHDLVAETEATPGLVFAPGGTVALALAGGDLLQPNGRPVVVAGLVRLLPTDGMDSSGRWAPARKCRAVLWSESGGDVTSLLVDGP